MSLSLNKEIIQKFDVPGPRYTSYPTAPEWKDDFLQETYGEKLKAYGQTNKTLSVYIHIPFCQTLCRYCGCNVVIRKSDEKYGDEYLDYLEKEIDLVTNAIGRRMPIRQLHWGGGTPTFLTENQIKRLYQKIADSFNIESSAEVAIEIDPRTIDYSKMKTLRTLGFNRVSMGVQDFDQQVQKDVNRIQTYESVEELTQWCRDLQFDSLNFDLIYGLPFQNRAGFQKTVEQTIKLSPDRIALYSFAHVPWLKKHQRNLSVDALPDPETKLDLFLAARNLFLQNGFDAIAMDHFAKKDDELAKAFHANKLYRNFMGYTVKPADEYIGLGVTSIGFLEKAFIQNTKVLPEYYKILKKDLLPVERGKILSLDDRIRQWTINSLMCRFQINKINFYEEFGISFDEYFQEEKSHLSQCEAAGLIKRESEHIFVEDLGKLFVRNICMGFDYYLKQKDSHRRFSRTI